MPKPMYVRNLLLSIFAAAPLAFFPAIVQNDSNTVSAVSHSVSVTAPIVEQPREAVKVTIGADGKFFTYSDELITPSDFTVAEEIEKRRINYPLEQKIELIDSFIEKGASYKTALLYCFPRLEYTVEAVSRHLYVAPVDAAVVYKNGVYSVSSERIGRALDEDRLYGGLYYSLKFFGGEKTVGAAVVTLMPNVRAHELKQNLTLRSTYTTDFSSSTQSRAHNVQTAVKKFDGISIAQGETLSFNATVGERTEDNGFKTAKIIVDGKYVDGVGGGVCQASTAVYNAAILAGLDTVANAHSICPSYCPPGLDAMISSASDLLITNNTESAVYFSVRVESGKATVRIFGAPRMFDIVPETEINETVAHEETEFVDTERKYFDANAISGDRMLIAPGKDGIKSTTYLKYYQAGRLCKRVKIRNNIYKQSPQIIAIAP